MSIEQIEAIGRAPLAALDAMSRAVWTDHAAGRLADAEAQQLAEAIEARRRALKRPVQAHSPLRVSVVREGEERAPTASAVGPRARARTPARGPRQLILRIPRPATYDRARSRERRRRPGARNMTNIIRVVSREWLAWIEHHSKTAVRHGRASVPTARHGVTHAGPGIGCKTVHPTDKVCSFKRIEGRKSE